MVDEKAVICGVIGFTNPSCSERDSDGVRCENFTPHTTEHLVGQHTIAHTRAGNGYACSAIAIPPDDGLPEGHENRLRDTFLAAAMENE